MFRTSLYCRRIVFSTCLVVCWSATAVTSNGEPTAKVKPNKVFHQMVMKRLDSELVHMQLSMRISDDQTQLLRDAGEKALTDWTKSQDPQALFAVTGIPQPVLKAIMVKADRRLGIAVANRYRKDLALEKKLNRVIGVDGAVTILDQVLALSEKQNTQLRKLVAANWQEQWLNRVLTSGSERINILRPALAGLRPQLNKILTPTQIRTLTTRHPSSSRALMANVEPSQIPEATKEFQKKSRAELQNMVAVRIEELKLLCKLDADQVAALQTAGKTAVEDITVELGDAFHELKVKGPGAAAPKQWQLISSNLFLLVKQNSTWEREIDRTLSPKQRDVWLNRQDKRQKQWSDSAVGGIAALLGQQHRFTAQQTAEFIKVLRREIDATQVWSTNDHYHKMANIDIAQFQDILTDEQRIGISAVFHDQRKK